MSTFNPIKEEKDGVLAKRTIWSTESIKLALKGLEQGRKLVANPFYENNSQLLKGDLVFERTPEEKEEWKKCAKDIVYFAEKYCKLMTPQGIQHIKLRDYQKRYLTFLTQNRLTIYLACRQAAKCITFDTLIKIKGIPPVDKLKKKWDSNYRIKKDDIYEIPIFELYNLFNNSFKWKVKYFIYNIIHKLKINSLIPFLYWILSIIDKPEDDNTSKIINSYELDGFEVLTDHGWSKITHVHETRPFEIYNIKTSGGKSLDCADNHVVFDPLMNEVFVKDLNIGDPILTSDGIEYIVSKKITNIKICMTDVTVDNPTHSYYTNDILSHNTTTSGIYLLWYILFNFDKNSLVIADVRKHAVEILDKTKKIFYEIPYFLKPGVYKWNESEIVMDNGCRIMASATTVTAAISYTFHEILWDEAAHLKPSFMEKFYNNLFPTITAAKAKFMITSTQGGYNLFYRLYKAAEAGDNEYKAFKTDWDEVPEWNPETQQWEKRDEAWRRLQIANYGSEEAFNSQFGTDFDVDVKTLINKRVLKKSQETCQEFINKDLPGVSLSENYYWKPDYDPQSQLRQDYIVLLGDLAEGVEKDFTNFSICRLIEPESDKLECIGYYRSNDVDRKDIAKSLMELCAIHCDPNHTLLSFERNTYGELFLKHIEDFDEKNIVSGFDKSVLVKFFNESGTKFEYGVRITRGNKNNLCILFKEDFEKGRVINQSTVFCTELLNFSDMEDKGVWKAAFGHDDSVMSMIQYEAVKKTLQFTLLKQEFDSMAEHPIGDKNYNPYGTIYDSIIPENIYDRFIESGYRSIYDFENNETEKRLNRFM